MALTLTSPWLDPGGALSTATVHEGVVFVPNRDGEVRAYEAKGGALIWELQTEKIALAHKAFKSEVLEKLTKIITQTGGTVETDS